MLCKCWRVQIISLTKSGFKKVCKLKGSAKTLAMKKKVEVLSFQLVPRTNGKVSNKLTVHNKLVSPKPCEL